MLNDQSISSNDHIERECTRLLNEEINSKNKVISKKKETIKRLKNGIKEHDKQIQSFTASIAKKDEQLANNSNEIKLWLAFGNRINKRIHDEYEQKIAAWKIQAENLQALIEKMDRQIQVQELQIKELLRIEKVEEHQDLLKTIKEYVEDLIILRRKNDIDKDNYQCQVQKKDEEISILNTKIASLKRDIQVKDDELTKLTHSCEMAIVEAKESQEQLKFWHTEFDDQFKLEKEQNEALKAQLKVISKDIRVEEVNRLRQECDELLRLYTIEQNNNLKLAAALAEHINNEQTTRSGALTNGEEKYKSLKRQGSNISSLCNPGTPNSTPTTPQTELDPSRGTPENKYPEGGFFSRFIDKLYLSPNVNLGHNSNVISPLDSSQSSVITTSGSHTPLAGSSAITDNITRDDLVVLQDYSFPLAVAPAKFARRSSAPEDSTRAYPVSPAHNKSTSEKLSTSFFKIRRKLFDEQTPVKSPSPSKT